MRHTILFLGVVALLSCGQNNIKQKELELRERELALKEKVLKQKEHAFKTPDSTSGQKETKNTSNTSLPNEIQNQTDYLSQWLAETIGCDFRIDRNVLKKANFNSISYQTKASSIFISKVLVKENGKKPDIGFSNNLITISYGDDDGFEIFFAEEDRFTYSHHLSAGSNGGSTVYNLITQKSIDYSFTFNSINNGFAEIERDGYGFDNNKESGHWWQKGKLNIETGKITWGTKGF